MATTTPTPQGCAVRMADGRLFTDYRPRCDIADQFANVNSIPTSGSYEYRQWLIHNGQRIIDHHRALAIENAWCTPCSKIPTMPIEKDYFVCSKTACTRATSTFKTTTDKIRSFGTGRLY